MSDLTQAVVKPEVKDACGDIISEPIDVVYTWVNGSDPDFIQDFEHVLGKCSKLRLYDIGYILIVAMSRLDLILKPKILNPEVKLKTMKILVHNALKVLIFFYFHQ